MLIKADFIKLYHPKKGEEEEEEKKSLKQTSVILLIFSPFLSIDSNAFFKKTAPDA